MNDLSCRKAKKRVQIKGIDGQVRGGLAVNITQKKHEFLFGCGAFDVMAYVSAKDQETKDFFWYRIEKELEVLNYMTVPVYWGRYEPTEGQTNFENTMKCAQFLKEHGVITKGHPLCWHTVCADWLLKYDDETIYKKQLERIKREVEQFKGCIDAWDVINETVIMPVFDKYDNAVTRICNKYGRIPLIKAVFDEAFAANENATLLINDFNTTKDYEKVIEECLEAGVKLNTIGIQSHQHQGYWGVEKINDVCDRFSKYGLPIHFTENTILSGDLVPEYIEDLNDWQVDVWPSSEESEELQARQVEEMYRTLFEKPMVKAITWWDFADGAWLNAPSGVIARENRCKKSYERLVNLINKEWKTSYVSKTDKDGYVLIDGFKGEYEISVAESYTDETCLAQSNKAIYNLSDESEDKGVIVL